MNSCIFLLGLSKSEKYGTETFRRHSVPNKHDFICTTPNFLNILPVTTLQAIPVAVRSKASVCDRALVGSNPARGMNTSCCECGVLSGRGLCDGPIPIAEKSY